MLDKSDLQTETPSIQTHLDKKAKIVHFNEKGLQSWLLKYAVMTDQSFLHFENPVFVGLLNYCHPGIQLPNRRKLKKDIMERYEVEKEVLKETLKNV